MIIKPIRIKGGFWQGKTIKRGHAKRACCGCFFNMDDCGDSIRQSAYYMYGFTAGIYGGPEQGKKAVSYHMGSYSGLSSGRISYIVFIQDTGGLKHAKIPLS